MKKRKSKKTRVYLPFIVIFVGFAIIGIRLFQLQVIEHEKYVSLAQRARMRVVDISPERGAIYDANMVPLGVNVKSFSLYASPARISNPEVLAEKLAYFSIGENAASILAKLQRDAVFVWVARKISFEDKLHIENLNLEGLGFIEEKKRFYPQAELMSHILGWVGVDNQGLSGLEYYFEDTLQGEKGRISLKRDARGYYIPFTRDALQEVIPGEDLVLTIDSKVQSVVEQELARTLKETNAQSVEAIFINPQTGAIIAMANKPDYESNYWWNYSAFERRNRGVQFMFEPGSSFKVITAAALLEEQLISPEEKIYCDASLRFGRYTITDWKKFNQELSFAEIMYHSSNIGVIKAAQRMQKDVFYRYITEFGFGQITGIDLPGEAKGLLRAVNTWQLTDFPCISMGQGIAVTPLQMVVALSAVVNGGKLMRPFVVKGVCDSEGKLIYENEPHVVRHVISEETSVVLSEILYQVVKQGTAKRTEIRGYKIGGKTGTAQVPSPHGGGYLQGKYIASFMGFAPVGNPEIVGIVVIKEPMGAYYGGEIAVPVFEKILSRILPLLGIMPEEELWVKN